MQRRQLLAAVLHALGEAKILVLGQPLSPSRLLHFEHLVFLASLLATG